MNADSCSAVQSTECEACIQNPALEVAVTCRRWELDKRDSLAESSCVEKGSFLGGRQTINHFVIKLSFCEGARQLPRRLTR